jgi:cytochrome b561
MIFMPFTGIVMGYFSGKGLPFFGYLIPGKKEPVGEIAGLAYKTHKWAGQVLQYLIPLHIAGAGVHVVKGQKVFHRMNPFA